MKIQQKLAIRYFRTKIKVLGAVSARKAAEEAFRVFCTPISTGSNRKKEAFVGAEPLCFPMNGKMIRGYRCNHPQQHRILLLHGFSSSARNFEKYVAPLVEKNYEVLAFDAPAHGESEGSTVNAMEYCEMIRMVNRLYGPVNGYLAHSFGGIAVSLALEEIPHDEHTRVVLIAPATETTSAIDGAFEFLGLRNQRLRKDFDRIIREKSGKETAWFSIRRAMNNIKASVCWFHDEDDDVTPLSDALKVKSDNHSNIKFVITKGLGHRKIYRDESVVNAAVKFL